MTMADPFQILGLGSDATVDEVRAAHRRLAKQVHPDVGGSTEQMRRVNEATAAALAALAATTRASAGRSTTRFSPTSVARSQRRYGVSQRAHDRPSFVVEALPAVAYEGLRIVAAVLGEMIDDDPPYRLDARFDNPVAGLVRLELVPEAAASTVSLTFESAPGYPVVPIEAVRDAIIDQLNQLDWDDLTR